MKLKKIVTAVALASLASYGSSALAGKAVYDDFPVTVDGYSGSADSSVSYGGQMARHVLHTSLKKLAGKGNGEPNPELKAKMMAYFEGKDKGRGIISPATKGGFVIEQNDVDSLSSGKNLAGKTYKGAVTGWPGNMTGPEVLAFMIDKASSSNKGYDKINGLDYPQLISKFAMGAVFYNQAVDNYLGSKLGPDTKPNDKPYSKGKPYTGKEHVWDEAFGYFGAPSHALALTPVQAYNISKGKEDAFGIADADNNGKVSLYDEMVYGHAYYAAGADKSNKTDYLHSITKDFINGRQLITDAKGKKLTDAQREELMGYAASISENWEKVIAEAAFKYAGSVYKDLEKLNMALESQENLDKILRNYAKHWGELKGFAMSLQVAGKDLGSTEVQLNRLIGFSPVWLGDTQITGIDGNGDYVVSNSITLDEYMLHMTKVQKLIVDEFGVEARANDVLASMDDLIKKMGAKAAEAEND